ncbi:MAG: ABC transporter permease [Faecalibacterium sp.]|jgi:ABC-2 type transport system permease protein|nr:ABC transporter permease [Faecalibacterium sp.]
MLAILKREWKSYFNGPLGYILTALLVLVPGIFYVQYCLAYGWAEFSYYVLSSTPTLILMMIYVPLLTMRSLSEERKNRTDQLLLTSPVPVSGIILGKYFAMCLVFLLPCLAYAGMLLVLAALGAGSASMLVNFAGLLCFYFEGCAMIAICEFLSGLTDNMIIAAFTGMAVLLLSCMMPSLSQMFTAGNLLSLVIFLLLLLAAALITGLRSKSLTLGCGVLAGGAALLAVIYFLRGSWLLTAFRWVLGKLCLFTPYQDFMDQTFSLPALAYYTIVIVLFLFFACQTLEKRRWN